MKDIVVVKFVEREPPYNAGETAGFSPETAARLVAKGTAQYASDEEAAKAPAAPTPAAPAIVVRRTEEPPFVETEETEDGEVKVKDVRNERDKMTRAPQRRK